MDLFHGGKWFCNGRVKGVPSSCVVMHLVRSKQCPELPTPEATAEADFYAQRLAIPTYGCKIRALVTATGFSALFCRLQCFAALLGAFGNGLGPSNDGRKTERKSMNRLKSRDAPSALRLARE